MVNAQEWLDRNYSKENRSEIKELNIDDFSLEGNLNLSNFINLEKLHCGRNGLTDLDLSDCRQLEVLNCYINLLTNIEFLAKIPNPDKLIYLDVGDNPFGEQELSIFNRFKNLTHLYFNTYQKFQKKNVSENLYNKFYGSLKNLSNLGRLQEIDITNTNVEKGLEYLSENVKFRIWERYKNQTIIEELEKHGRDFKKWREVNYKLVERAQNEMWKEKGFSEEERKQWIEAGLKENDYDLANYLKNHKKLSPLEIVGKTEEFQAAKQSEEKINNLIHQWQSQAFGSVQTLEKIPYEQLNNIEILAQGGFGQVYRAEWKQQDVILKKLNNSQNVTRDFLQEIAKHRLFKHEQIVKCYGISQDLKGNYVMVMEFIKGGNLREYLQRNSNKLDFKKKLIQLSSVAEGLNAIHKKGLMHRDFHLGNILSSGSDSFFADLKCYITDLGLCKPANEKDVDEVYGVLPYVAPEVLQRKPYTQKSDIYSFGIIMNEIITGLPPYYGMRHDVHLALEVCQGLRPHFQIKIPSLLEDLIKRCWDADSLKRPSMEEISNNLRNWIEEINEGKPTEFIQQTKKAQEYNKSLPNEVIFPIYRLHSGTVMYSKLINTKQITKMLQSKLYETVNVNLDIDSILGEVVIEDNESEKDVELTHYENFEDSEKTQEILKKKVEVVSQLEREKNNFEKLQRELSETQNKIQQLEVYLGELESKLQSQIQIFPK